MRISLAATLAAMLLGGTVHAAELPLADPVPGGVAIVPIAPLNAPKPIAYYQGRRVMVSAEEGQWQAVVGLSLDLPPGHHTLRVLEASGENSTRVFLVEPKNYTVQHVTLKNRRMVRPESQDVSRISSELERARAAFGSWSDEPEVSLRLLAPVKGRRSGEFGLRRFFNGEQRRPHSGIDIAAPLGSPVVAPASGRVVEVGDYFFNGKTLFVDHGQGLVTMYAHLNSVEVEPGQEVTRGEVIATVGATGRATGPHLHWTISLNGAAVDPGLFLAEESDSTIAASD